MLVVGLIVGAGITYALAGSGTTTTSTSVSVSTTTVGAGTTATQTVTNTVTASGSSGLTGTVTIGDLTDLSGQLQAIGAQQKVAVGLAITDINNYLDGRRRYERQVRHNHEDTGLNPATALTDLQTLSSDGVQVVVGPLTSGEASNVLQYADTKPHRPDQPVLDCHQPGHPERLPVQARAERRRSELRHRARAGQ